jgi:hypothetical protein
MDRDTDRDMDRNTDIDMDKDKDRNRDTSRDEDKETDKDTDWDQKRTTTANEVTVSVVLRHNNLMKRLFSLKIIYLSDELTLSLLNVKF